MPGGEEAEEGLRGGTAAVGDRVRVCTRLGEPRESQSLRFLLVKCLKSGLFAYTMPAPLQRGTALAGLLAR